MNFFRILFFSVIVALLFFASCGDSECEPEGIEDPPVLVSDTPFTYDRASNKYMVNISAEGGEYVFNATDAENLGTVYRNDIMYHHDDKYVFHNDYITVNMDGDVITIKIVPNVTEESVSYIVVVCGLDSFTKIVFNQSKAK